MILPGAEAAHGGTPAAPELRSPWSGRSALPGWWRLMARRQRAALDELLRAACAAAPALQALDDAALAAAAERARAALRAATTRAAGAGRGAPWPAAAAAVAELAARSTGLRPDTAQLEAALAITQGRLVDAGPCSGKTLALAMAAVLGAWAGRRCHVACVNELAAARHAAAMAPLYERCGVRCAVLLPQAPDEALTSAYEAPVLLTTARRLMADCLNDPALWRRHGGENRHWALVDDADRVLIDDAVQPLVLSAPGHNPLLLEAVVQAREMAQAFRRGEHYEDRAGVLRFTPAGQRLLDEREGVLSTFWRAPRRRDELVMQALVVRDRFVRGRHYQVQSDPSGAQRIVLGGDTPVAALVPQRTLHTGLLQALEAREGLPPSDPPVVTGRLSHQELFGRYRLLGGIASTLGGLEGELWRIYGAVVLHQRRADAGPAVQHAPAPDHETAYAVAAEAAAQAVKAGAAVLVALRRPDSFRAFAEALRVRALTPAMLGAPAPSPEDGVLAPGQLLLVPDPLLPGLDVRMAPPGTPLLLLQPEALESARAETLFAARGLRGATERRLLRLWPVSPAEGAAPALGRAPAVLRLPLLRIALGLQRRRRARQARLVRRQLFLQEQQLLLQLAFAARGDVSRSPR